MKKFILSLLLFTSMLLGVKAQVYPPATNVQTTVNGPHVSITWDAPTKSREVLFTDDFESGNLDNWTQIDANDDGRMWAITTRGSHSGSTAVRSASWDGGSLTPDNYLITPLIEGATRVNYWVAPHSNNSYDEHYAVMASSTGTNVDDFTLVFEETLEARGSVTQGSKNRIDNQKNEVGTWRERTIELPEGTKYIAFRHYNCTGVWFLYLDDVTVYGGDSNNVTYNVTKNGTQLATGLTETAYIDNNVAPGTHEYCVEVVYTEGTSDPACAEPVTIESLVCNPASNVLATVNENGTDVNVTWTAPSKNRGVLFSDDFESGNLDNWTQIDADGDGHMWAITTRGSHSGTTAVRSASWDGATLHPNNYLITPLVEGATNVSYWVALHGSSYPGEHYAVMASSTGTNVDDFTLVFEETLEAKGNVTQGIKNRIDNQRNEVGTWYERNIELPEGTKYVAFRHYNCSDVWFLYLDDVTVYGGDSNNVTYNVTKNGVNIVTGLTETTYTETEVAPGTYEYCVEVVYANCTSQPACAEPVTIESLVCSPATNVLATVNENGTDVNVTWNAPAKSRGVLFTDDFESGNLDNWTQIDADGDGHMWAITTRGSHSGSTAVRSASWDGATLYPNNYLITPLVDGATSVNYWVAPHSNNSYNEHYAIMASSTGTDVADFTLIFEETFEAKGIVKQEVKSRDDNQRAEVGTWRERTIELPEGTKYVAFRHYNCSDVWFLYLDDVTVYGGTPTPPVDDYTYTIKRDGNEIASELTETSYTDTDVAPGTYEYCVEVVYTDCTSEPACAEPVTIEDLVCDPVTNVQATVNENGTDVNVTWTAPAKNRGVLFTDDFESGNLENWTQIDADGDGHMWAIMGAVGHESTNCVSSASYIQGIGGLTPDNYLITPLVEGATSVNYWISSQHEFYPEEYYAVMASTTGTNAEDFTIVFEELMLITKENISQGEKSKDNNKAPGPWYERTVELPAGTKYVAFRHFDTNNEWWLNLDDVTVYGGTPTPPVNDFTYTIKRDGNEIATELTETSYTDADVAPGTYEYCVEVVYATCTSESECAAPITIQIENIECDAATNVQAIAEGSTVNITWEAPGSDIGSNITYGFETSLAADGWTINSLNSKTWTQVGTISFGPEHVYPHEGSVQMFINWAWSDQDEWLISPQYNIPEEATLTFWTYITYGSTNGDHYYVKISTDDGETWSELWDASALPEQENYYNEAININLSDYSGQSVRLAWQALGQGGIWYPWFIDDITIASAKGGVLTFDGKEVLRQPNNSTVTEVNNPATKEGKAFNANAKRPNSEYTYTITRDGEEIATNVTETSYTDNNLAAGTYEYCVKVVYSDCTSEAECAAPVTVGDPDCIPVTNVQAVADGSNVDISWNTPAILLSESFENETLPEGWTQIDADGDGHIWNITTKAAHSGSRSLRSASWNADDGALNPNNYLITPLVENATSVNYWVAVHGTNYQGEHYAIMASSTGTDVDDFTLIFEETLSAKGEAAQNIGERDENQKLGAWYERTVELPEGTKYVAFRHYNCSDIWYLYLDDVTVYGDEPSDVTYTITRNGVEIATDVTETAYTDIDVENGTYNYCVQAVYSDCVATPTCADPVTVDMVVEIYPVNNLTCSVEDDVVTLNWNKPSQDGDVTIILETTDVWGDGSGYQLLLDADAIEYGQTIPISGPLWDDCSAPTTLYDVFEYKVPKNADPVCTTQNMVLNKQVVINIPAGIYDFCLVNPTPNDKLWIATGDNGRKTDYEFESGKTYHFFVEFAAGNDMTTITVSDSYTGEVLDVVKSANQTIDENSRQGEGNFSSDSQSNYTPTRVLTGYNVYKNGTMIDQITDPDILTYVDNNVADGTHNYCIEAVYDEGVAQQVCRDVTVGEPVCEPATNVQAIADGSTVNVTWTAPASTKAGEIQFFDDFETGQIIKWTQIDADGDGHMWFASGAAGYNSAYSAQSRSWIGGDGALTPDNYLITPIIENATKVQYWVCVQSSWYPNEHYAVMASSTGTNADDFTVVFEETMTAKGDIAAQQSENREDNNKFGTWYERNIDLPEGTKYVAFRHYNCTDQLGLNLDNVAVFGGISVPDYTYTITRNGAEIVNGLTETSYTDNNVSDGSYEYCVEVVYPNCTSDAACAEPIVINSIDSEFADTFKVYPNPAKDIINVDGDVANIVMYNSIGQAVRTNLNNGQIDVSSLENGIYYLVITGSDRTQKVEKVIIAK